MCVCVSSDASIERGVYVECRVAGRGSDLASGSKRLVGTQLTRNFSAACLGIETAPFSQVVINEVSLVSFFRIVNAFHHIGVPSF